MKLYRKTYIISFQRTALLIMSAIALPLFIVVVLFEWNTLQSNHLNVNAAFYSTLSAYRDVAENSAGSVQRYIVDAAVNNNDFQMIVHAKNKTEVYLSSVEIEKQCRPLLQSHEILGGFYIYSSAFNYYHIIGAVNYLHTDLDKIQASVIATTTSDDAVSKWIPVFLSDRTVFLYTITRNKNSFSVMLDPSRQTHSELESGSKIFFTTKDGIPLASETAFGDSDFPSLADWEKIFCSPSGHRYDLLHLPLTTIPGHIIYAIPHSSFFEQLNTIQRFLMIITLCLLISIPVCWLMLRRLLLQPLVCLTETTQAIKTGHMSTRVPRNSHIAEVNAIAETVNTMLDTIQQQKIEAYERELSVRDLQLQYLQLQLRPHFFLNCLNLIYSLAEEKNYSVLQELTLNLSTYLRSIFKDGSKLVALADEIHSVESYIRIQGAGMEFPPQLEISMNSDTADILIPPISILTFAENAVKHANLVDTALLIRIKCEILGSEEERYLYITICDNGGGFSSGTLKELNNQSNRMETDGHIGISNIRHRLMFLYGFRATISFRNRSDGACVELFIPIDNIMTGGTNP